MSFVNARSCQRAPVICAFARSSMMREMTHSNNLNNKNQTTVEDIMIKNPTTVAPTATLTEALALMRDNKIGCLPVVNNAHELVGVITEMDFLRISTRLIDRVEK